MRHRAAGRPAQNLRAEAVGQPGYVQGSLEECGGPDPGQESTRSIKVLRPQVSSHHGVPDIFYRVPDRA